MKKIISTFLISVLSLKAITGNAVPVELTQPKETLIIRDAHTDIYDIYLIGEIGEPEKYINVANLLENLASSEKVVIHIAGPGGSAEGAVYLINAMRSSKASITTSVDGSIASASANIALAGQLVRITSMNKVYIYLHNVSSSNMSNEICKGVTGLDRGLPAKDKCLEDEPKITKFYNDFFNPLVYPLLTKEERLLFDKGHDIIITSAELSKRLSIRG